MPEEREPRRTAAIDVAGAVPSAAPSSGTAGAVEGAGPRQRGGRASTGAAAVAGVLVADIGGTNARFGLYSPDGTLSTEILHSDDYPTLEAAIRAFLASRHPPVVLRHAAFAVAGPVTGDYFHMTNSPWAFSISQIREALGLDRLEVVNDFIAAAMAVPHLGEGDRQQIGEGEPAPGHPIGVIGPGTGLGVSTLVPGKDRWRALDSEGGHVTMAAITDRESAVLASLRKRFDHVSAERVLSGMGLVHLYEALSAVDGREPQPMTPVEVSEAGLKGTSPVAVEALETFCAMLGTVAGNLALTVGARGGVYVAGGIVPRLGAFFARSRFRKRFVEKGRLRDYLGPVPTYVITHPLPAFLGLKAILEGPPPEPAPS